MTHETELARLFPEYAEQLRKTPTPDAPEPLDDNPAPTPAAVEPME